MKWQPIETAPKDGTRFIGWMRAENKKRITWYGKASHVPIYGWCHGRDVEDIDMWNPTYWRAA
jgi:hypothetical protein